MNKIDRLQVLLTELEDVLDTMDVTQPWSAARSARQLLEPNLRMIRVYTRIPRAPGPEATRMEFAQHAMELEQARRQWGY